MCIKEFGHKHGQSWLCSVVVIFKQNVQLICRFKRNLKIKSGQMKQANEKCSSFVQFTSFNHRTKENTLCNRIHSGSVDETIHTLKKGFSISFCTDIEKKITEQNKTKHKMVSDDAGQI